MESNLKMTQFRGHGGELRTYLPSLALSIFGFVEEHFGNEQWHGKAKYETEHHLKSTEVVSA